MFTHTQVTPAEVLLLHSSQKHHDKSARARESVPNRCGLQRQELARPHQARHFVHNFIAGERGILPFVFQLPVACMCTKDTSFESICNGERSGMRGRTLPMLPLCRGTVEAIATAMDRRMQQARMVNTPECVRTIPAGAASTSGRRLWRTLSPVTTEPKSVADLVRSERGAHSPSALSGPHGPLFPPHLETSCSSSRALAAVPRLPT